MYKRKYYFYNFITEFILIYRVASYVSNLGFFRDTDQKKGIEIPFFIFIRTILDFLL